MKKLSALLALFAAVLATPVAKAANATLTNFNARDFVVNPSTNATNVIHINPSFAQGGSNQVVFAYPVGVPPFLAYWIDSNHLFQSSAFVVDTNTIQAIRLILQELMVTGAGTNEMNNLQVTNWVDVLGPGTNEFNNLQATNYLWSIGAFYAGAATNLTVAASSGYAGGGTKFLSDDGTYKAGTSIGPTYAVTNYLVGNGGNLTITTNVSGTNVSWTFTGVAQTNVAGANPTASVGLSTVNGSALTFLRSDGAPALDQSIAPTWTGTHTYSANVFATITAGASDHADANKPSQTNQVSGSVTLSYATNGVDGKECTVVWRFPNSSGSDQTLTLPVIASGVNGWRTNVNAPVPTKLTNATETVMLLRIKGDTSTLAKQTNVQVAGFEYYP